MSIRSIRPIPAHRPWLYKTVRIIRPWMTWSAAATTLLYAFYRFGVDYADSIYLAMARGIRQDCIEATKLTSECREYGYNAAGLPIAISVYVTFFLLMAIAVGLGYIHMMLRDGWAEGHLDAIKILLGVAVFMLVLLLLAVWAIYGLRLFWPELPEPTTVPRTYLPSDRRV